MSKHTYKPLNCTYYQSNYCHDKRSTELISNSHITLFNTELPFFCIYQKQNKLV